MFDTLTRHGSSAASDFEITKSTRFSSDHYSTRTPGSAGNRQTWTISFWAKRSKLDSSQWIIGIAGSSNSDTLDIFFGSGNELGIQGSSNIMRTTAKYRDVSAWAHFVIACNTTLATESDRFKIWVNGERVTDFATSPTFSQNTDTALFRTAEHNIGRRSSGDYYDGYLSHLYMIDGQALEASDFGETKLTTGQWIPKKYTGTYGTQGCFLSFEEDATTDSSGNGNNFSGNNFNSSGVDIDFLADTPTNNYPTYLSTQGPYDGTGAEDVVATFSNGNLNTVTGGTGTYAQSYTTMAIPTTGKWYIETAQTGNYNIYSGIGAFHDFKNKSPTESRVGISTYDGGGFKHDTVGSTTGIDLGFSGWTTSGGMVLGIAVNMDDSEVTFYRANVAASSAISFNWSAKDREKIFFYSNDGGGAVSSTTTWVNFGQRAFATSDGEPPSGYKRLCSQNLPDPVITKPTDYFGILLWTGNDAVGNRLIDGLDFNPDFHLLKSRTVHAGHWGAFDSVRGVTSGKETLLNAHSAEGTEDGATYGYITTGTGGFTYVTGSAGAGNGNANYNWVDSGTGAKYVAWNWKAGGSGSSNSSGGITSTVSASTTAGFSIVKYTGTGSATTVGHGLGVKPEVIIVKNLTDGASVPVSISGLIGTGSDTLYWGNKNSAASAQTSVFPATLPTSTVFSVGTHAESNASSKDYIAYCFTPVAGYSKFGTYTGTGQAGTNQGVFIYTGFKPALIIIKRTDSTGNWAWNDHKRDINGLYGNDASLYGNTTAQETTSSSLNVDFLSNGFKLRSSNSSYNGDGGVYMYMAFAERPFKYANAE